MPVNKINEVLDSLLPIGLGEMDAVRLMNRIDTKYVLPVNRIPNILTMMDGGYRVMEINSHRFFTYTTTYLDTVDFLFFNQHVTGKPERNKVRYRKYETTGITFLEVKQRMKNNRTIKWRIENNLKSDNKCDDKAYEFLTEYIPQKPLLLKPVLTNTFKRVTLVGSAMNERVTIDYDLSFSDGEGKQTSYPFIAIIELKKEGLNARSPFVDILKESSLHPTGFSKYCIGAAMLYDIPRKNNLKPTFLLINKIQNEFNRSANA
jgi:hypothetical protein